MFTPVGTPDGPVLCDLLVSRTTLVDYEHPHEQVVVNDVWASADGKALLDRRWTGRTIFQVKTSLPIQIDTMVRDVPRTVETISRGHLLLRPRGLNQNLDPSQKTVITLDAVRN